jgi:hypothetical protein
MQERGFAALAELDLSSAALQFVGGSDFGWIVFIGAFKMALRDSGSFGGRFLCINRAGFVTFSLQTVTRLKVRAVDYCRLANIRATGKLILMVYRRFALFVTSPAQLSRSFGILTGLRAGRPRNHFSNPAMETRFVCSPQRPDLFW